MSAHPLTDIRVAPADDTDPTRGASDPGRCWTLTNMSETTSDVLSASCWSLWTPHAEFGARLGFHRLGVVPRREVRLPTDINEFTTAPFFGRQALNVDRLRELMGGLPGTSPEDVDRNFLGVVRHDAPPVAPDRWAVARLAARAPAVVASHRRVAERLHDEQLRWWQSTRFDREPEGDPSGHLLDAVARFEQGIATHAVSRFLSQALQSVLTRLAESVDRVDLVPALYAGFGDVTESAMAEDLWLLSRDELSEGDVLRRHGYHGMHEGNVSGTPWRLDPAPVRALAESMRRRSDDERPSVRAVEAVRSHDASLVELLGELPGRRRPVARRLVAAAGVQVRTLELSKAAFSMAIDGVRSSVHQVGRSLCAAGVLADPTDAVHLALHELVVADRLDVPALVDARRTQRDLYRAVRLPAVFNGMPVPLPEEDAGPGATGPLVVGASGSGGRVRGTARVAATVMDAAMLEPGEILVCHTTDPSWAGAMALASGLVIDVGAPASHGAIVARELGVPCVIGTGDGTVRIRDGQAVIVDGDAGTVEIISELGDLQPGPS